MEEMKFDELQRYAKLWGVSMFREDKSLKDLGEVLFELNIVWSNLTEEQRITCATIIDCLEDSD